MTTADNPLLTASDLPYEFPPFDRISGEHFLPAFEAGMAEQSAEVEAIATNPEPPTFDNTIVALERSGELLDRVSEVFFNLNASHTDDTLRAVHAEIAPKLSAHSDAIHLNPALFARVERLYEERDSLGLDEESAWLLRRYHLDFVRAGAALPEADQARLRELNTELSSLATRFQDNLLADTNDLAVLVKDREELAGLPEATIAAAAEAAAARGEDGGYLLTLALPTRQPLLASLENRALRERVFRAATARGNRGNEHDNKAVLVRIARLRAERAALLGYPHHAAYVIEDETAGTAEAATELLHRLAPVAVANARAEAAELAEEIARSGADHALAPWDWTFYAERVRKRRFDIDEAELRPYFELDRVLRDGVFHAATMLYGLTFTERPDLPVYHPDARVFEVFDADGGPLGLFIADFYARDSKRGGAWMNSYRVPSRLLERKPVVVNNLNVTKPPEGEPALLSFDEVETMFHEFGHALHELLSDTRYPTFAGTNVPRDFVEFPSQVNEMWVLWPEVLANYACHYRTGEPLPERLVEKLRESSTYGEGFATTEYLAASLLDLAWHTLDADTTVEDVAAFQAQALEKAGVAVEEIPPRYASTYFAHIFCNGYSAGYYSYIWSEVLDADTVEWFRENGGLTRANGDHFRRELLSRGGSKDAMAAFRAFRGRDPEIEPLLKRRGLTGA
ncbi:M3 family metallopeptidase [Saccharomonospora xinjiangensis]|uniref:M3 family metallopeptidase n=1 Tax=Saccharomonospora xinjiangensis TaxID=75294 RepID=UPI001070290F|nr:M3 family metallopeptidase [Saccharomonospora xinjiangensis]QBQ60466.1 Peptidyl-dipeptidase dcp [Saccharomonospora xinjiangensis]